MHAYYIDKFIKNLKFITSESGIIIFEIPDISKMLNNGDCSMIWEEHIFYFTEKSFKIILEKFNLKINILQKI